MFLDTDPLLRRVERRAVLFCAGAALIGFGVSGRADVALGVLGGGLLSAVSYWAIRAGITLLADPRRRGVSGATSGENEDLTPPGGDAPSKARILLRLAGRYALLGLLAYGMIARLRLSPIGLLIGVSSLPAAASLEALGFVTASGRRRPRA